MKTEDLRASELRMLLNRAAAALENHDDLRGTNELSETIEDLRATADALNNKEVRILDPMTNTGFVVDLMENHCPTGAMVQMLVIEGLGRYSELVLSETTEIKNTAFVSAKAWRRTAEHVKAKIDARYGGKDDRR